MRFLKRLKFLKIQRELSDDSNVTPFTNFNVKSDLLLTRGEFRAQKFSSVVCQKVAQKLPQVCLGFTTLETKSPQDPARKSDKERRENESTEIPRKRIVVRTVFATA